MAKGKPFPFKGGFKGGKSEPVGAPTKLGKGNPFGANAVAKKPMFGKRGK